MRGIQAILRGLRGGAARTPRTGRAGAQTVALLLGALSLPLAACNAIGSPSTNGDLAASQSFTWPYVDAAGTFGHNEVLDPAEITSLKDTGTTSMLYMGLVTYSPTLTVRPDAAQRWDVDPTGTIYTFHLRPNLKFSDGKPITASDFA
jgi:ABC-type transport system substrate-binding protein